jgi:hypothetical protein
VTVVVPARPTAADINAHFARLDTELFALGRYAAIVDARLLSGEDFTADLRQLVSQRYQEFKGRFSRFAISEANVLDSPLQRGVLTAIHWVAPPPWETKTFSALDEAERWSLERLAAAGRAGLLDH